MSIIIIIIIIIILSITKFSIVIGYRRVITGYPITGVGFELFVTGLPLDSYVNYASFNGFLRNVSLSFQNLGKALQKVSFKSSSYNITLSASSLYDSF